MLCIWNQNVIDLREGFCEMIIKPKGIGEDLNLVLVKLFQWHFKIKLGYIKRNILIKINTHPWACLTQRIHKNVNLMI